MQAPMDLDYPEWTPVGCLRLKSERSLVNTDCHNCAHKERPKPEDAPCWNCRLRMHWEPDGYMVVEDEKAA